VILYSSKKRRKDVIHQKKERKMNSKGRYGERHSMVGGFDGFWLRFTALNETTVECLLGWAGQHTFGSS